MNNCDNPSRGSYTNGCRCFGCRLANSDYEYKRSNGLLEPKLTDASKARRHVNRLLKSGLSRREICRAAAVSRSALHNLLIAHHRTGKPIKRISIETSDALLSVKPTFRNLGKRSLLPNDSFIARIDWLVNCGLSMARISRITGIGYCTIHQRRNHMAVTALNAGRLMKAWPRLEALAKEN